MEVNENPHWNELQEYEEEAMEKSPHSPVEHHLIWQNPLPIQ